MLKTIYNTELVWGRLYVYNAIVLWKKIVHHGKPMKFYSWETVWTMVSSDDDVG